jgi:hypothetical protein
MPKFHRTLIVRNVKDKPLELYVEFFVPKIFKLPAGGVFQVHAVSSDPLFENESLGEPTFSVWIEGEGIGVQLPGSADLIDELFVLDLISGTRLDES